MGDRANIKIIDGDSTVYLYTHNIGSDLPKILQEALKNGQDRFTDGQYLARIIFCEMVRGCEAGTSGFGISSVVQDGEDRIITIDIDNQTVQVQDDRVFPLKVYLTWANPRWMKTRHICNCVHCIRK